MVSRSRRSGQSDECQQVLGICTSEEPTAPGKSVGLRLLHTSDWHLGQSLHGFDRTYEHEHFLRWLVETLVTEQVDALLVAGDVFDSANPPALAQRQLYEFLVQAHSVMPELQMVFIGGNHDSPARLEAPAAVLKALNVTVVGAAAFPSLTGFDSLVVPLRDKRGTVAALCLAIPFLRLSDLPRLDSVGENDSYSSAVAEAYERTASWARARLSKGQALVALGHCHLRDGKASEDSERRILVGGSQAIPTSVFPRDLGYVALGHLHLAQSMDSGRVQYSGSPFPLSFSEVGYRHQVTLVELDGAQLTAVRPLLVPRSVDLLRVPEVPLPIDEVLTQLAGLPADQGEAGYPHPYLSVQVLLDGPEPGLRHRIETDLKGKAVRLAKLDVHSPERLALEQDVPPLEHLCLQPLQIAQVLYGTRFGQEMPVELERALVELASSVEESAP